MRRLSFRRRFEPLELRQMMAVMVLEHEDNDSDDQANRFAFPDDGLAELVGDFSTYDDERDQFRFTVGEDSTTQLAIRVSSPTGTPPQVEIKNAAGSTIARIDPSEGVRSGIAFVTTGEIYYVRVEGDSAYRVELNLPPRPHAFADQAAALENGSPVMIDVLANDVGNDLAVIDVDSAGLHGEVAIAPGAVGVVYSVGEIPGLEAGRIVAETFQYTLRYDDGKLATASVTVTVTGENHAPTTVDDTYEVGEDAMVVIPVLANDADIDAGDTKQVIAVHGYDGRAVVQVASGGAGVWFATNGAYNGLSAGEALIETVTYTMSDRAGAESTGTLVLTILGANDAPEAHNDSATVEYADDSHYIDVSSNDTDPDRDDLNTVVSVDSGEGPGSLECIMIYGVGVCWIVPGTPAIQGSVAIAPDGKGVIYSPGEAFRELSPGQSAAEVFRYTIRDGSGAESTSTVVVSVQNRDPRPIISGLAASYTFGETVSLNAILADAASGDVEFQWRVGLAGATIATGGGDNFNFVPDAPAVYEVMLTATDSGGRVGVISATLTVVAAHVAGDTNGDGVVDLADLNNVRNHFGGGGQGDANGDGVVDLADLNAVRNNFGSGEAATTTARDWYFEQLSLTVATSIARRPRWRNARPNAA